MNVIRGLPPLQASRVRLATHLRPSYNITQTQSSPFQHIYHGRRSFHWASAWSNVVDTTEHLIVGVHELMGHPWFLVIPFISCAVGIVFRTPFLMRNQEIAQRRIALVPLMRAWNARNRRDVMESVPKDILRLRTVDPVLLIAKKAQIRQRQTQRRIYRKLGLQTWRVWANTLVSFPVWLSVIAGVRQLCQGSRGVAESNAAIDSAAVTTASLPPDFVTDSFDAGFPAASSAVEAASTAAGVDPSLTIEGCLWFTDLTVADPYHILPLALSCAMLYNVLQGSKIKLSDRVRIVLGHAPSVPPPGTQGGLALGLVARAQSAIHLVIVCVAALIGPLTMTVPAAIHLYWLASTTTNVLIRMRLEHLMPVKPPPIERRPPLTTNIIFLPRNTKK
ncbi:hypothetical protein F4777DRAFT_480160 [Nemania sp. FL0916]|nr:hypothetical protein F4777DRAFT_480160 [Nemania sp. FL0916]